jgi:hypothetical protein
VLGLQITHGWQGRTETIEAEWKHHLMLALPLWTQPLNQRGKIARSSPPWTSQLTAEIKTARSSSPPDIGSRRLTGKQREISPPSHTHLICTFPALTLRSSFIALVIYRMVSRGVGTR